MSRLETSFMWRALALARRGSGSVSPNPLVGALIVKDDKILGGGWHRAAGEPHAEVEAIRRARLTTGGEINGSTLYVTLEPCAHQGRTPPCTEAIIRAGISRAVVAMRDPNPHVQGGGVEILRAAGVAVSVGLLEEQANELNRAWRVAVTENRPYVILKLALSADGKLGTPLRQRTGPKTVRSESAKLSAQSSLIQLPWTTSAISRAQVHRLRRYADAVMVGAGTVIADNPQLTNRSGFGRQPHRVVVDSTLRTPLTANVYRKLGEERRICITTQLAPQERRTRFSQAGVEVHVVGESEGKVDLAAALEVLNEYGVQCVICEGGAQLAEALMNEKLCDRVVLFSSPSVMGEAAVAAPAIFRLACQAGDIKTEVGQQQGQERERIIPPSGWHEAYSRAMGPDILTILEPRS